MVEDVFDNKPSSDNQSLDSEECLRYRYQTRGVHKRKKKKKNRDFFFSRVSHTKNNYRAIISYNYTVIIFCVGNPAKIPPLQLFPDVNYGILKTPLLEGFWLEEIILRLLKF